MMIYIVQEFLYGEWSATIGAYTQIENAFEAIGRIMEEEQLRQKDYFTEGTSPFTEYSFHFSRSFFADNGLFLYQS